jgi:hypothetical protein
LFRNHLSCELTGQLDNSVVDTLEYGGQVFILFDLVLFGDLVGPHDFADLVDAARKRDEAVDLGLVDLAALLGSLPSDRFGLVEQQRADSADALHHILLRHAVERPTLAFRRAPEHIQRTPAGVGEQVQRGFCAFGKRAQRPHPRERFVEGHDDVQGV